MNLRAGKLNKRIELQSCSTVQTDTGAPQKLWTTYATVWAGFRTLSGRERLQAQQVGATLSHEIVVRHQPSVTISPQHRIKYGDRYFDINDVRNIDERNDELRVRVTEAV